MPHLPAGQHVDYMFQTKTTQVWKQLFDEGKLNAAQSEFWRSRPAEALYDLQDDRDETKNLIFPPATRKTLDTLKRFRDAQREHALKIRDVGFLPEDEIHLRSAFRTPYELGHDAKMCPLERILATAELASSLTSEGVGKLGDTLKDDDSAVRYWSALGLLIHAGPLTLPSPPGGRGQGEGGAVTRNAATLRELLKDESPSVRVVAAEALGQYGTKDDVDASLKVLLELGHPTKNSIYVSLAALNALDRLGEKMRPALATLRDWPTQGTPADHRAAPGIARLLTKINKELKP
jgi:hypothetical protein